MPDERKKRRRKSYEKFRAAGGRHDEGACFTQRVLPHQIGQNSAHNKKLDLSCVKVEVNVLGSPSLTVLNVMSVDVKQHLKKKTVLRAQERCESRGGRPGLPVPNSP